MPEATTRTRIAEGGRIIIPAEYRKALNLHVGDEAVLQLENGELRVRTLDQVIAHAQAVLRQWIPNERSLTDELIAERRLEAARE